MNINIKIIMMTFLSITIYSMELTQEDYKEMHEKQSSIKKLNSQLNILTRKNKLNQDEGKGPNRISQSKEATLK